MKPLTLTTSSQKDYELIDSGDGEKLERYGSVVIVRPDPQIIWPKRLPIEQWLAADAEFSKKAETKKWSQKKGVPESWPVVLGGNTFIVRLTSFKHTGIFPEQFEQWEFMIDIISRAQSGAHGGMYDRKSKESISVLNLFGYTGGATMACLQAGAEVTHVDASRSALTWAKENCAASGFADGARLILEDALVFAHKELKRGKKYDAIIMDPPAFGRGAKGEIWKIEEKLAELLDVTTSLLSDTPLFIILNGYAAGYSAIGYANALEAALEKNVVKKNAQAKSMVASGILEAGELTIEESVAATGVARHLPAGIFARWRAF